MLTGSTLYWTQREMELVLYVSGLWRMIVLRTQGMWIGCERRIGSGTGPWVMIVEGSLCRKVCRLVGWL